MSKYPGIYPKLYPHVLTTYQLISLLGLSLGRIQKLIDQGELRGYRTTIGGGASCRRVRLEDALAWARAAGHPCPALYALAEACGLVAPHCPTLLILTDDPATARPFGDAGWDVAVTPTPFTAGLLLAGRPFRAILLDTAGCTADCAESARWCAEACPRTLIGVLLYDDSANDPRFDGIPFLPFPAPHNLPAVAKLMRMALAVPPGAPAPAPRRLADVVAPAPPVAKAKKKKDHR